MFAERYRIERRLASGGMGAVYEVVHLETNRRRALKVLHTKFIQNDSLRHRFRQEARVAAEIDSEFIVDVFDAGIDATTGMPFLVMELLRGEDVRARVRRDGPMPHEDAIRYLYETCLALEKTHHANIVHRDLKPDNLFLCEREHGPPRIKVLDFGIAKIVADGNGETQATQALGTPLYMAPEQFSMGNSVSPATDIFALGLIAYTMLTGKPYWATESKAASSPIAFALHASKGPKESPVARAAELDIHLPPEFDAWFFRATAEKPSQRFPSAMSAVTELAEVLGVPLPHEAARSKSGSGPFDHPALSSPQTPALAHPGASDGPIAISVPLHPAVTPPSSVSGAIARKRRPLLSAAGILATLMAGSVVDMIASEQTEHVPAAAPSIEANGSASNASAKPVSTVDDVPRTTTTAAASSSAAPQTVPEVPSAQPASSASSTDTAPKNPKIVRPGSTGKKPSDGVIWNND